MSAGAGLHGPTAESDMAAAVAAAKSAEAVVFVIGGDWKIEHEGMDRSNISLPGDQAALVTRVRAAVAPTVPVVTVLVHGGSMDISFSLCRPGHPGGSGDACRRTACRRSITPARRAFR